MVLPTLARRSAVFAGAGVLTLTALVATAPPASAAVLNGQAASSVTFSSGGGGGAGCSPSDSGGSTGVKPFASGGPAFSANLQETAQVVDPVDAADVTTMTGGSQGRIQARESGGVLTGFNVDARLRAAVSSAQGAATECDSSAYVELQHTSAFTLASPTILDLRIAATGRGTITGTLVIQRTTPPNAQVIQLAVGLQDRTRRIVTLPAGDYVVQAQSSVVAVEPNLPSDVTSSDFTIKVRGTFSAPGAAVGVQKGTGNKFLTLPSGLACATHSVVGDFTKKAGPKATKGRKPVISKATFYVNDAKVKTARKPHKNTKVKLAGLPDQDELVVEARLKLRGKGVVTVSRTYLPCS